MTTSSTVNAPSAVLAGTRAAPGPGTPALVHFTCGHFYTSILAVGALIPHRHPLFPTLRPVVWLTSELHPERHRVGLTSDTLACDRMDHRFLADETSTCLPWPQVRDAMVLTLAPGFDPETLWAFEYGRAPDTWWVSAHPVPVVPA